MDELDLSTVSEEEQNNTEISQGDVDFLEDALEHYSTEEVLQQMMESVDIFGGVAIPTEVTAPFARIHNNVFILVTQAIQKEEGFDKFAIGIPRGHAKTFLLKLIALYSILFSTRNYILVVCNTAKLAEAFIADVADLLDSENIINLFGDWRADITNDTQGMKKFYFRGRDIVLKANGKGGAIRGTNVKFRRPDFIICDDIQSLEESFSIEQSMQLLQWFLGTLLKARSARRCTVVYLGNMYPDIEMGDRNSLLYTCLLRNLQLNSTWTSWITGAILADGTALWEEVRPLEELLDELRQDTEMGQPEIFYAEVQNDPGAVSSKWFNPDKMPAYPYMEQDVVVGKFLVIDPSLGKKKSDDQIVGLFYVYDHKGPVLREVRNIQKSSPDLVQEVITWALTEQIPLVCAESVAYQQTLIQWFEFWARQLGLDGIQFAGVTPKGQSKNSRILAYFKSLMTGTSMLHDSAKNLVISQAKLYNPTKNNNVDDILDVGAYGEYVFVTHQEDYLLPLTAEYAMSDGISNNEKIEETVNDYAGIEFNY